MRILKQTIRVIHLWSVVSITRTLASLLMTRVVTTILVVGVDQPAELTAKTVKKRTFSTICLNSPNNVGNSKPSLVKRKK